DYNSRHAAPGRSGQGAPASGGKGLSGAGRGRGAGLTEGAAAGKEGEEAEKDGGGGVRLLAPRLLRAYLPLGIITLSDLECDYINARSCCSKLNKWVIPELVGHAIVTVLMLVSLHWFIFLLNLPVATWNIYRYIMVPSGNMGVFDPTEIHNRGQLKSHMKEAMIKLGFHLLCFFMYLY
ncbi:hypothetical protein HPG69_010232, partial [Diceros bicornis minor]